jgi:hypothetical protein
MKIWNTSSLVSLRDGPCSLVALVQRFADGLVVLAGQLQAQPVVLDALAPQVRTSASFFGQSAFSRSY